MRLESSKTEAAMTDCTHFMRLAVGHVFKGEGEMTSL